MKERTPEQLKGQIRSFAGKTQSAIAGSAADVFVGACVG